jgi:hypothetical protein
MCFCIQYFLKNLVKLNAINFNHLFNYFIEIYFNLDFYQKQYYL